MNDYIKEVASYIIDYHTIKEASEHFHKSPRTIKLYLAKVRDANDANYDKILAEKLQLAQLKIQLMGVKKGGQVGRKTTTLTEEEKREYAKLYLSGLTYEKLANISGIPKSTLQENIRSIDDTELQSTIDGYVDKYKKGGR